MRLGGQTFGGFSCGGDDGGLLSAAESAGAWCEQRQEDLSCQEVWRPAIRGSEEDGGCTEAGDYFITCQGRVYMPFRMDERFITTNLLGLKERLPENVVRSGDTFRQLNLFDDFHLQMPVEQEDKRQVLTGQL